MTRTSSGSRAAQTAAASSADVTLVSLAAALKAHLRERSLPRLRAAGPPPRAARATVRGPPQRIRMRRLAADTPADSTT